MNFSSEISLDDWYSPSGFAVAGIDNGASTEQRSDVPLLADRFVATWCLAHQQAFLLA